MILSDSQLEQYGLEFGLAKQRGITLGTFEMYVNAKQIGQEETVRFDRLPTMILGTTTPGVSKVITCIPPEMHYKFIRKELE